MTAAPHDARMRILIVEDRPHDAALMVDALEEAGYDFAWTRTTTEHEYQASLDTAPDAILCDYHVPGFGAARAVEILAQRRIDVPCIVVSAAVGEEQAVALMQAGADDFVHKDHLGRLPSALERALERARLAAEKRRAEAELGKIRARLQAFLDYSPAALFLKDAAGRYVQVNRRFEELAGVTQERIIGRQEREIFSDSSERASRLRESDLTVLGSGAPTEFEEVMAVRGKMRTHLVSKFPIPDETGEITAIGGIAVDITRRKREEGALRATFDQLAVGVAHTGADGRFLRVNRKLCEMLGYSENDLLERTFADVTHPEDRGTSLELRARLAGDAAAVSSPALEKRYVTKDGAVLWALVSVSVVRAATGESGYFVAIVQDITGRKLAEETLKETQARLAAAVSGANLGLWDWDLDTGRVVYSPEWKAQLGYAADEIGDSFGEWERLAHPEDRARTHALIERYLAAPWPNFESEFRMRHKDGSWLWMLARASWKPGAHGGRGRMIGVHIDITERKLAEQKIRRLSQLYGTLSEANGAIVRTKTTQALFERICGIVVKHNPFALAWVGLLDEACGAIQPVACAGSGVAYLEDLRLSVDPGVPEGRGITSRAVREGRCVVCTDVAEDPALALWRAKARQAGLRAAASLPLFVAGKCVGALCLMAQEPGFFDDELVALLGELAEDISFALESFELEAKNRSVEAALLESDEKFRQLAQNIPQVFWITDTEQRNYVYVSPAYEMLTGRPVAELQARPRAWLDCIHPDDLERVRHARRKAPLGEYDIEYRGVHADGTVRWVHDRAFPVRDTAGKVVRIAGICEDITERKLAAERLQHLAHYDTLTELPNRLLFQDRLEQVLMQARRNDWIIGLLFIDLDHFKMVNDTLGHTAGDALLRQVAVRLKGCVRGGDTVARLGGDEFAVVLSELAAGQDARRVVQKILDAFAAPFLVDGHEVFVTASIGITLYPEDSLESDTLLRNADAAMFRAKERGRSRCEFFTAEMNRNARERMQLENGLRRALERREFVLHYQPKIDVASGTISGLEALLRWHPPENGLVPPGQFIPLLEETGLIVQVGEWVLQEVCTQIRAWRRVGIEPPPVALNLSARQLREPGFDTLLVHTLERSGVEPHCLELEITESALMEDPERASAMLERLCARGVRLSVDDFGTGYSSLAYLKRFPLDALKIDRSFVKDLPSDAEDAAITRSVISLAHSLELKVVAEGVETEAQLAFLRSHGCDEAQGFLFSRPLPAALCAPLLGSRKRLVASGRRRAVGSRAAPGADRKNEAKARSAALTVSGKRHL